MGISSTPITEVDVFTAAVYPPQVGTPALAGDVIAGEQALANRTHFLEKRRMLAVSSKLKKYTSNNLDWGSATYLDAIGANASDGYVIIPGCAVGDLVLVDVSMTFEMSTSSAPTSFEFQMHAVEDFGGANNDVTVPGSYRAYDLPGSGLVSHLKAQLAITSLYSPGTAGDLKLSLQGQTPGALADALALGWSLRAQRFQGF